MIPSERSGTDPIPHLRAVDVRDGVKESLLCVRTCLIVPSLPGLGQAPPHHRPSPPPPCYLHLRSGSAVDELTKEIADDGGAALRVPHLPALKVDVRDAEPGHVTFGPLEIAAPGLATR